VDFCDGLDMMFASSS